MKLSWTRCQYSLLKAMPCLAAPDESPFVPLRALPSGKWPMSTVVSHREELCPFCLLTTWFPTFSFSSGKCECYLVWEQDVPCCIHSNFPAAQHSKMFWSENATSLILTDYLMSCWWKGTWFITVKVSAEPKSRPRLLGGNSLGSYSVIPSTRRL